MMATPAPNQSHSLRVLTIAELNWRNGYEFALQAVQLLQQSDVVVEYRIIGEGPFLEAVSFARYELGLKEKVIISSDTSIEQKDKSFDWADIFLLAAVADGAPHALDEAITRGIPVVCTDVPEIKEKVIGRLNVYLVPRRDPSALAGSIMEHVKVAAHYAPREAI